MIRSLAAAAVFAIAVGTTVPADAAMKRDRATAASQASTSDSVDLSYVAGHGSPSRIKAGPRRKRAR